MAAAVMVVGGASLAAAPAASAASIQLTANCFDTSYQEIAVEPGDVITVNYLDYDNRCSYYTVDDSDLYTIDYQVNLVVLTVVDAPTPGLFGYVVICTDAGGRCGPGSLNTLKLYYDPAAAPVADVAPIPVWVQAYGRASADATCLEGWNPSWDLWPNEGKGGFTCQRSIPSLG